MWCRHPLCRKGSGEMLTAAHTCGPSSVLELQGSQHCSVKYILWALLCECRTRHVLGSVQVTGQLFSSLWSDSLLLVPGKFLSSWGSSLNQFGSQQARKKSSDSAELSQAPTFLSPFQMRMERPLENRPEIHLFAGNSVVVTCHNNPLALQYQKVRECMAHRRSADSTVVKNSWFILRGKFVCIGYRETRFTNGALAHNNALHCLPCWNSFLSTLNISRDAFSLSPPRLLL